MSARVSSMTGFARVSGDADWGSWAIEAKSVNGRSLDVRVNVSGGFEEVERAIKQAASKLFARGNIQIGLRIEVSGGAETLSVNHDALQQLLRDFEKASGRAADLGAIASLMGIKGVVETGQGSTRAIASEEAVATLQAGGDELIAQLNAARLEEGAALEEMLSGYLAEMARVVDEAEALAAEQPKLLKARLEKQLAELDAGDKVDGERLAAEIALSVAKADVREEIDRLRAHIESGRGLLRQGGPIGRKLDFLSQEFNREANTLCSKSADTQLTNIGLALKATVDRLREQVQNVE